MATMTQTRRPVKSNRSLRVSQPVHGVRAVALTATTGRKCGYYLSEIAVDFGRGFQLDKFETEEGDERRYHVHLDNQLGDSCTCKGHTYKSHCKHVDAVKKLIGLGILATAANHNPAECETPEYETREVG